MSFMLRRALKILAEMAMAFPASTTLVFSVRYTAESRELVSALLTFEVSGLKGCLDATFEFVFSVSAKFKSMLEYTLYIYGLESQYIA